MIESLLIGIGGIIGLMVLWFIVQQFWHKSFSEYMTDEDVLAGRSDCGNCGCTTACKNKSEQLSTE